MLFRLVYNDLCRGERQQDATGGGGYGTVKNNNGKRDGEELN